MPPQEEQPQQAITRAQGDGQRGLQAAGRPQEREQVIHPRPHRGHRPAFLGVREILKRSVDQFYRKPIPTGELKQKAAELLDLEVANPPQSK